MADLEPVAWPPEPIHTKRPGASQTEGGDRAGFIDLHASAEVGRYLGGPRARAELETLCRRSRATVPARGLGCGYASEASRAALDWAARALPDEPVLLCTQSANTASVRLAQRLGFVEVERFECPALPGLEAELATEIARLSYPRDLARRQPRSHPVVVGRA